jgi:hypothetical protein
VRFSCAASRRASHDIFVNVVISAEGAEEFDPDYD